MRRMFTEDVIRASGNPRFRKGEIREYPKSTWNSIAASLKKDLDDFTVFPEEAASASVKSRARGQSSEKQDVRPPDAPAAEPKDKRGPVRRRSLATEQEQ